MISASVIRPHYDEKGFDTVVVDDINGKYAVFDGMGVSEGARFASSTLKAQFEMAGSQSYQDLAEFLNYVNQIVKKQMGGSTATIVKLIGEELHFAHLGDSRLYILLDGRVKQITADEGYGNILYNHVGGYKGVCQLGIIPKWDKFMICSDGITGDWPEQWIPDSDIEVILNNFDPEEACHELIAASKKNDDKSVIVVTK